MPNAHEFYDELLSRLSGGFIIFPSRNLLFDENVKHASANLAGVEVIVLPLMKLRLARHDIQQTAILDVNFHWSVLFNLHTSESA
jgi:hypothetical protein